MGCRFEEKNRSGSDGEIGEMLRLMRDVGAEIRADHAMPKRAILLIEFLLNRRRDVFLQVILLGRLSSDVHGALLHLFGHVGDFDDRLDVLRRESVRLSGLSLRRLLHWCKRIRVALWGAYHDCLPKGDEVTCALWYAALLYSPIIFLACF